MCLEHILRETVSGGRGLIINSFIILHFKCLFYGHLKNSENNMGYIPHLQNLELLF